MEILKKLSCLRLGVFSLGKENDLHAERYKKALFSILANVLSKVLSLILMVISISLTIPYLGVERFGIWMTISSFVALLGFLDLGIGNALTNRVASAAVESREKLVKVISGGLIILIGLGLLIAILLMMVSSYTPWEALLKVNNPLLLPEIKDAGFCFAILFGLSIFSGGCQRIFLGLQQSYIGHAFSGFGFLIGIVALFIASKYEAGIDTLLIIVFGSQVFANSLLFFVLVLRQQFQLRNSVAFARVEFSQLCRAGGIFFLLQIGGIVGWGADSLIISSTIGVAQVAIYAVVQRLFQIASQPFMVINAPLWGAYADAEAHGDKSFIRKTLKRSMLLTFFGTGSISFLLILFHTQIIDRWTQGVIVTSLSLVIFCGVWSLLDACGNAFAMFLNGTNVIRQQLYAVTLFILLAIPLKFGLIEKLGLIAVPLATIAAYSIAVFSVYGCFCLKDIQKKLQVN